VETQNRRDMVEAKTSLEKAMTSERAKAEALFNLGALYAARKTTADRDKALGYFAEALKLDQESETAKQFKPLYDYLLQSQAQASKAGQSPPEDH
jgi:tetratricopeptide (TPR) repeat protein